MAVLDKSVFRVFDCIQMKPGEPSPACQTRADGVPGPARHVDAGGSGRGGTRDMGYGTWCVPWCLPVVWVRVPNPLCF